MYSGKRGETDAKSNISLRLFFVSFCLFDVKPYTVKHRSFMLFSVVCLEFGEMLIKIKKGEKSAGPDPHANAAHRRFLLNK